MNFKVKVFILISKLNIIDNLSLDCIWNWIWSVWNLESSCLIVSIIIYVDSNNVITVIRRYSNIKFFCCSLTFDFLDLKSDFIRVI